MSGSDTAKATGSTYGQPPTGLLSYDVRTEVYHPTPSLRAVRYCRRLCCYSYFSSYALTPRCPVLTRDWAATPTLRSATDGAYAATRRRPEEIRHPPPAPGPGLGWAEALPLSSAAQVRTRKPTCRLGNEAYRVPAMPYSHPCYSPLDPRVRAMP
eukprot:664848-Rhodomonas_salina.2